MSCENGGVKGMELEVVSMGCARDEAVRAGLEEAVVSIMAEYGTDRKI